MPRPLLAPGQYRGRHVAICSELCRGPRSGGRARRDFHLWSPGLPSFSGASGQQPRPGTALSGSLMALPGNHICGRLFSRWNPSSESGTVFLLLRPGRAALLVQFPRNRKSDAGRCANPDVDVPFARRPGPLPGRTGAGGIVAIVQTDRRHSRPGRTGGLPGRTRDRAPVESAPRSRPGCPNPRRGHHRDRSVDHALGVSDIALLSRRRRSVKRL